MLNNPLLTIPILAWIIAQVIKFSLAAARGRLDYKYLYASGGMPSAHSAVVTALATTALLLDGGGSHIFGLTAVVAAIVMYDSFGVRRSSGEQAVAINALITAADRSGQQPKLREILGHSPLEVTAGAVLGFLLACLFNLDRLTVQLAFLTANPVRLEAIVYAVIFASLLVGGIAARIYIIRRYPKAPAFVVFAKQIFWKTEVVAWPGLITVFAKYENLPYLRWRLWPLLLLVVMVVWDAYLIRRFGRALPQALEAEREAARKQRWFARGKTKKRRK